VLISAELASVVGDSRRLEPLGYHTLRGVRDPRKIYALDLGFKAHTVTTVAHIHTDS
jgi:class 3 adenylate cyclase